MDTDALAGGLNETMRRYNFIVVRFSVFQEKWKHKENLSERTIIQYNLIINSVLPKIMNLEDFSHLEYYGSSVNDVLLNMMNDEANSNEDVRSIRSALLHIISEWFWGIASELRDSHLSVEDRRGVESFTIDLDKLDMLLKWFEALLVMKFAVCEKNADTNVRKALSASDRGKIYQCLITGGGRYWGAVSVLFLTGCSPDDVRRGVHVGLSPNGSTITFGFDYSKIGDGLIRGVGIAEGDPFYDLAKKLKADHSRVDLGGTELWRTSELARTVSYIGTEIGLQNALSPTSFRHSFACDLGRIGFSRKIIAKALGFKNEAARITFVRPKMGLKGRKVRVAWSEPGGNMVVHSTLTSNFDRS